MGNADTKLNFRKAIIQLTTKTQPIEACDDTFWEQFWSTSVTCVQDVFTLIPASEIRALREESPSNLATLCYKAVEKLVMAAESGCPSQLEQQTVLNCARLLTRILPYIFEDPDWRGFFWSTLPGQTEEGENESPPLAQSLLNAVSDLLFCPEFTVSSVRRSGPDNPEDMNSIDSCEYIWESGVGFAYSPSHNSYHDQNRTELLKLCLTCFSETMYLPPMLDAHTSPNQWTQYFTSTENRHALPLFTSLLNCLCSYNPVGYGMPYNHLMFSDYREPLVEVALQVLCVTMENESGPGITSLDGSNTGSVLEENGGGSQNLFLNYLSRIHREEDFSFILKGITHLLNNPLIQTYLPGSCKRIHFNQELLVLFWKMCDINKKFMFFVLKSSDVLDVLVPILYNLNIARADQSRVGLMHIGVFILLLLSGERNFGVRLNKPYSVRIPMDIPVFTGTHADFLIIVFHKIITTGHQRLQPLFDCLLTIIVNVSPYLKTLSMVSSTKLLHLLEAFGTPWFLFACPTNHHLAFFLLEVFNNIIQYQFDGNSNLVYTIIRKRNVFNQLANLPVDNPAITQALTKRGKKFVPAPTDSKESQILEGANHAVEAEPGTLKVSLADTPRLDKMIEKSLPNEKQEQSTFKEMDNNSVTNHDQVIDEAQQDIVIQPEQNLVKTKTEPVSQSNSCSLLEETISTPSSPTLSGVSNSTNGQGKSNKNSIECKLTKKTGLSSSQQGAWVASPDWVQSWKQKLPLQTIMRMLQVLVPQVEKICIDKGLTDETEILKFLQHGTLVGLLPVPHPILIRKYQANNGTTMWFRTYLWGVIYLRNVDPPIWYDTNVKLFEIQRV